MDHGKEDLSWTYSSRMRENPPEQAKTKVAWRKRHRLWMAERAWDMQERREAGAMRLAQRGWQGAETHETQRWEEWAAERQRMEDKGRVVTQEHLADQQAERATHRERWAAAATATAAQRVVLAPDAPTEAKSAPSATGQPTMATAEEVAEAAQQQEQLAEEQTKHVARLERKEAAEATRTRTQHEQRTTADAEEQRQEQLAEEQTERVARLKRRKAAQAAAAAAEARAPTWLDDLTDEHRELMVRNALHTPGGKGWGRNTSNRRVLVTHDDGEQTVEMVHNDLGLHAGDKGEMRRRLREQGILANAISVADGGETADGATFARITTPLSAWAPPLRTSAATRAKQAGPPLVHAARAAMRLLTTGVGTAARAGRQTLHAAAGSLSTAASGPPDVE